jgi:four helix bundle protein
MSISIFSEIESWKESRKFAAEIYALTSNQKLAKDYGFKDQLLRASVSIMSNIAEGFDSGSKKSFINYLNHSFGSSSEVQSLLFIAFDIGYISKVEFEQLNNRLEKIRKLIGGFIKYLKNPLNESSTKNKEPRTKNY